MAGPDRRVGGPHHLTGHDLKGKPSPGNKEGGIKTILEKSLGAVAKGGHRRLDATCGYAEPIPRPGFVFMDTPGLDPVPVTGMVVGCACSGVVDAGVPLEEMGRRVYDLMLDTASGRRTFSEELALGGEELVPWQLGAVL